MTTDTGGDDRGLIERFLEMLAAEAGAARNTLAAYAVSYTHLRAHETPEHLVCRLLLEKKKKKTKQKHKK